MPCRTCGSPLAADQRYCLECGERHGAPRLDWKTMVVGSAVGMPDDGGAVVEHDDGVGPGLPTPRIAAALVLGVLAFGVIVGNAAGPGATTADAGGHANLTILAAAPVLPAAVPAPAPPAPTPQPPTDEGDSVDLGDTSSSDGDDTGLDDTSTDTVDDTSSTDAGTTDATPADDGATDDSSSTTDGTTDNSAATPAPKLPPVKHVWVVALTGHSYGETFGAAPTPPPRISRPSCAPRARCCPGTTRPATTRRPAASRCWAARRTRSARSTTRRSPSPTSSRAPDARGRPTSKARPRA